MRTNYLRKFMVCALAMACTIPVARISAQSAKESAAAAVGSIHGTVVTETTDRPLLNAQVSISKLGLETHTDSVGNFLLKDVPFGTHNVMVKLEGFESLFTEITVVKGEKVGYDLVLKERIIQYAPKAARKEKGADISRDGLIERRNVGNGRFITEDVLKEYSGKPTADIIKNKINILHSVKMAGYEARAIAVTVNGSASAQNVRPSEADRKAGAKIDCYASVILNKTVMYQAEADRPLYDVNSIPSGMIMSVEYFNVSDIPSQYALAASPCGLLVIQTRGR
ncbi:MAG: carboxypeptidase-like regulatory domain-containing protein [Gemmatimonadaceae bacterium]